MDFVELADVLEHLARGGWRLVARGFVLSMTDQAAQVLDVSLGVELDEAFQRAVAFGDQAVTPAFEGMEAFVVLAGGAVHLVEHGADRVDILFAHQLADELDVAFARGIGGMFRRFGERAA